jgi:hypothetical protein
MIAVTMPNIDGKRRVLKGNPITHFFVTAVRTWEDTFNDIDGKWNVRDTRCWGYTNTFEKAESAVISNYTDIHECTDDWVIIEEYVMDVFAINTGLFQWYHWNENNKRYERCCQPEWAKSVCHWGIG